MQGFLSVRTIVFFGLFIGLSKFCVGFWHWIVVTCALVSILLFPAKRKWILSISPFALVALGAGPVETLVKSLDLQRLSRESLFFIFIFFQAFAYYFQKTFRQKSIRSLTVIITVCLAVEWATPSVVSEIVLVFIFFCFYQFFTLIINSDTDRVSVHESVLTQYQIWSLSTLMPIPLPLLRKHEYGTTTMQRLYPKALKLLVLTMGLAFSYNSLAQWILDGQLKWESSYFLFAEGSSYQVLEHLVRTLSEPAGYWLGMLFIGLGVFVKISVGLGYAVAIARMCGFDLPANINSEIFRFRSLGGFMRGFYYYYNYLITRIFFPRVKRSILPWFSSWSVQSRRQVGIFSSILFGGLIFNTARFGLPIYHSFGGIVFLQETLASLVFYVPISLLIAYTANIEIDPKNRIEELKLALFRIWVVILFSALLLLKTSMRVQKWNLQQIADFFSRLLGW